MNFTAPPPTLADRVWRLAFRLGFQIARALWRLTRPRHEGALVAVYVDTELLLVRQSYRPEWTLPGGGVRRGENPDTAARRELAEEVSLNAATLAPACALSGVWDGRRDRVHFFELRLPFPPKLRLDGREIVAARLVPPDELGGLTLTKPVIAYLEQMPRRAAC